MIDMETADKDVVEAQLWVNSKFNLKISCFYPIFNIDYSKFAFLLVSCVTNKISVSTKQEKIKKIKF